jgi:hypothetical protein
MLHFQGWFRMFHTGSIPRINSKRTLVMNETDARGDVTQRTRPAAQILLKDAPQPSYKAVRTLDGEQFALAWGGPYISSDNSVEIRTLDTLVETISDLAAPLHLAGRKLVANGPLCDGQNASARVYDLDQRRVIAELPLAWPYVLSSAGLMFGRIRRHYDFEDGPIVAPSLSARFPELRAIIDADGSVLVCCDLAGKVAFTISEEELAKPYPELTGLVLSRGETTLYYCGRRSVGAVDISGGQVRWVRHFGANTGERFLSLRSIALSPDETRLAVGGMAGSKEPSLRMLSTLDGNELDRVRSDGRWDALLFHGSTLIAAGSAGRLMLLDECKQRREMKAASSGINEVAILGDGLLCACDQRQLRYLPLLDDE